MRPIRVSEALPPGGGGEIRPDHEAHHSPLSSTKAKNEWSSTSTFPYAFMTTTITALHFEGLSLRVGFGCGLKTILRTC